MKRFFGSIILLFLVVASVYWLWQLTVLKAKNKDLQQKLKRQTQTQKQISLNDFYLLVQKERALEQITAGQVYFSGVAKKISNQRFQLNIYLLGPNTMKTDAADLAFKCTENCAIEKVKTGQTFPQYPKKQFSADSVSITGIASLAGNKVKLGEPNTLFASVLIRKLVLSKDSRIAVDQNNTKAYLNGSSVLNQAASMSEIVY